MALSDIVAITIQAETAAVTQAGFGVPLILSAHNKNVDRIRYYTDLTGLTADGFTSADPEYKAMAAMFAQSPRPEKVALGRCANRPTQTFKITVASVLNNQVYSVKVGANTASFTSDGTATNDEIVAGLVAAINALSGDTTTATDDGTGGVGNHFVRLTANAVGNWDYVEVTDLSLLAIAQDHVDPGVAADLDAIKLVDNTWYGLTYLYPSKATILAIAAWAEANEKLFISLTQDSNNATLADGSDSNVSVMKQAKTSAYARTALIYHSANGSFADAAWLGKCLPFDPGSETWAFKTLAGVAAVSLTSTQSTNLDAKNGNWYETIAGVNVTRKGRVSAPEYIDVVRGRDWLKARMSERIYSRLANSKKVPYTDVGIAIIEAEVRAQLQEGVNVGLLASDPAPKVTVPKVSTVAGADKTARVLKNVRFDAVLAGAIHTLNITGTIAV